MKINLDQYFQIMDNEAIAKNIAQLVYISKGNGELWRYPSSSEDEDAEDFRKARTAEYNKKRKGLGSDLNDENTHESVMIDDPNKFDLINHLTSLKLLAVSDAFDRFPKGWVDVDHFVNIMREVLADTQLIDRPEFISELVDLFYRASSDKSIIYFENLTTYLIEHEIDSNKPLERSNYEYYESKIIDQTTHNNYIGKIYYFDKLDKMLLYEQNNKTMRIYEGKTMRLKNDIICSGTILAIEFITKKKLIAVLLSNRKIYFYDATTSNYKIFRELEVPCTQKWLWYVHHKDVLFSGGTNGAIFGWELNLIFSNEFVEDENKRKEDGTNFDYRKYLAYNTPWFELDNILCIVDLPNINFLATGSSDSKIRLWDLRTSTQLKGDDKTGLKAQADLNAKNSNKTVNKAKYSSNKRKDIKDSDKFGNDKLIKSNDYSFTHKEPSKELEGHK